MGNTHVLLRFFVLGQNNCLFPFSVAGAEFGLAFVVVVVQVCSQTRAAGNLFGEGDCLFILFIRGF